MKRLVLAMTLLPAALLAQTGSPASPAPGPDYSQSYCSGFITHDAVPRTSFVLGSKESPHEDRFPQRSVILLRGPGLAAGTRYSIVRQVIDPNREDSSPEQRKRLASLGAHYDDIGWMTVQSIENGTAVGTFDFACEPALPGDIVVPFHDRPTIGSRNPEPRLQSFRSGSAAMTGQILGARDYVALLGAGTTVFTDFGGNKGAKPGDYLVISRGYAPHDLNRVDRVSERLPRGMELSAVDQAVVPPDSDGLMPNRIVGEMVVLSVSPEASVAMITRTAAEVELGDKVQLEGAVVEQPASAATPPASHSDSRLHRVLGAVREQAEKVK